MWIYNFGNLIAVLFISIYIFKIDTSILDVISYNIVFFTATLIGFSGVGYLYSVYEKNIKTMYYLGYVFFILSFIVMFLFLGDFSGVYVFGILYGLGNGIYWSAVHTNELVSIDDKDRDFYSSFISIGSNLVGIITPLIVSFIFIFANNFNYGGYFILFFIIPIVYLVSFLFIKNIGNYIPTKIHKKDVTNFFNLKKYFWGQFYLLLTGITHAIKVATIPIIAILILKNEINIGFFESAVGIISVFIVMFLSHKRNKGNRLKIFGIVSFLIFLTYIFFAFYFNIYAYIIFSLVLIILNPIYRVSEHVYDLKIMDTIKNKKSDFFPSMILREITLFIGRLGVLILAFFLVKVYPSNLEFLLKIFLIVSGFMYLLSWFAIKMHIKHENYENLDNLS